jgi:hypothetical protein
MTACGMIKRRVRFILEMIRRVTTSAERQGQGFTPPTPGFPAAFRARFHAILAARGIVVVTGPPVTAVEAGRLVVDGHAPIEADEILWTTRAAPARWLAQVGLPVDPRGFLKVDDTLRVAGFQGSSGAFSHSRPSAASTSLRKVEFTAARLQEAFFVAADLRDAKFDCELDQCADLRDATIATAQLQGASLRGARLHGAFLTAAQLQGASLDKAELQAALDASEQYRGQPADRPFNAGAIGVFLRSTMAPVGGTCRLIQFSKKCALTSPASGAGLDAGGPHPSFSYSARG